jgi:alpha-L-fucosidase
MKYLVIPVLFLSLGLSSIISPPKPFGATPSANQLRWHEMKYYAFVHFNMNTFTDFEWGHGTESPDSFNPTQLDCRQWARICKQAGMKGIIITAKHHDGFCLFPSAYTKHSVKYSKWRNGKGDVLKDLSAACKEYGLKFGVYLSPWDRNHPDYGTPAYNEVFKNTLKEVLTNYGEVFEVWFDGANGEGPNGKKQVYDWKGFVETVRKYQPKAVIFSDGGPDVRWVGNEEGYAGETNWNTLNRDKVYPGYPQYWELTPGHEDGTHWLPAEVDVSIRPGWYYHASEDNRVKSLPHLATIYYNAVGRGANLLLNIPVDRRGLVHENDSTQLIALKDYLKESFAKNLALHKKITATNLRGNDKKYTADNLLDGKPETYWTTDDAITQASLEVDLEKPTPLNCILLQEYIALGQRIKKFSVEKWDGTRYQPLAAGTTIGNTRILRFPLITTDKIRINIESSKACPILSNIEIYKTLELIAEPKINRNKDGLVSIVCEKTTDPVITYTIDGSEPTNGSPRYTAAFSLPLGGIIKAKAFVNEMQKSSTTISESFDICAAKWKVVNNAEDNTAIDGNTETFWINKQTNEITLDLGEIITLNGFTYLPRQDGKKNGIIYEYNFYVSEDGKKWDKVIEKATFANIINNPIRQKAVFAARKARFVRFESIQTATPSETGFTIAELTVITRD